MESAGGRGLLIGPYVMGEGRNCDTCVCINWGSLNPALTEDGRDLCSRCHQLVNTSPCRLCGRSHQTETSDYWRKRALEERSK